MVLLVSQESVMTAELLETTCLKGKLLEDEVGRKISQLRWHVVQVLDDDAQPPTIF